jgi:hypothetical protein
LWPSNYTNKRIIEWGRVLLGEFIVAALAKEALVEFEVLSLTTAYRRSTETNLPSSSPSLTMKAGK